MICTEQRQEFFDFANAKLNADFSPLKSRCISVVDGNYILGVVVMDRFSKYACEINIASDAPRFFTKSFIKLVFSYLFEKCGIIRVTALAKEHNKRSIKLIKGVGFIEEARLKLGFGDQDAFVFRMLKDECRWIKGDK